MLHTALDTMRRGAVAVVAGRPLHEWAARDDGLMYLAVYLAGVYAILSATARGCP
jgi:hypothetical protein